MILFSEYFLVLEVNDNPIPDSKAVLDKLYKDIRAFHKTEIIPNPPKDIKRNIFHFIGWELRKIYGSKMDNIPIKFFDELTYDVTKIIMQKLNDPFMAWRKYSMLDYAPELDAVFQSKQTLPSEEKPEIELPTVRKVEPKPRDTRMVRRIVPPAKPKRPRNQLDIENI